MNEQLFKNAIADFDYLNKVFIESTAQVAYNATIFEAALSDEVLTEAEDGDKKSSSFKNALYKALEAVKSFAASVFNKIRVAINEFIAKINQNSFDKAMESWKKERKSASYDLSSQVEVKLAKSLSFPNIENVIMTNLTKTAAKTLAKDFIESDLSVDKVFENTAAEILGDIPENYSAAKKALKNVTNAGQLNKIIANIVSYADDNNAVYTAEQLLDDKEDKVPDLRKVSQKAKSNYAKSVSNVNSLIKQFKGEINGATNDKVETIKKKIAILNAELGLIHAGYIGYLKWAVACNKQTITAIKTAKKEVKGVEESFMGLALL